MTIFQAFILGLLQGLAEFLPVSSSAHLFLAPWFFKWEDPGLAFDVFLHGGTLIALLLYFGRDWIGLIKAGIASALERKIGFDRERLLFWLLVIGSIPGALAGLKFEHVVEEVFRNPLLVAINLALLGFLLYWVDGKYASLRSLEELTPKDALWIGIAQAFAIFPGVSRSGSTITMARLRGVSRESAARFSFMLALPITGGAVVHKLPEVRHLAATGTLPWGYLITGFVASAVSGLLAIHVLLTYVRIADYRIFAWYRVALAAFVVLWSLYCNC